MASGSGGSAALYWVHGNHMGVPLVTIDASGAVVTPPAYTMAGFPGQTKTLSDIYYTPTKAGPSPDRWSRGGRHPLNHLRQLRQYDPQRAAGAVTISN